MESSSQQPTLVLFMWFSANGTRNAKLINFKRYQAEGDNNHIRSNYAGGYLLPTKYDSLVPELGPFYPFGDMRIRPDKSTFKQCPWNPKLGMVFVDIFNLDGTPFDMCGRHLLRRAKSILHDLGGYLVKIGIEIEFVLIVEATGKPFE